MSFLLIWGTICLLLFLLFLLAKFTLKKYFDHLKGRFDAKSNYLSYIGITTLLSAFVAINPSGTTVLINLVIKLINKKGSFTLEALTYPTSILDLLIYSVLSVSILSIIYMSYRHRMIQYINNKDQERESLKEKLVISFPEQDVPESPIFHLRIKELFELKYARYKLDLQETKDQEINKVLYGFYEDDFNTIFEIIYCDNTSTKILSRKVVEDVLYSLESKIFKTLATNHKNPIAHYYYISERMDFLESKYSDKIKCYTEDILLNSLIDFKGYLLKLKQNFESEKLFSAILNDENRKTLAETFIEPAFYAGNKKSRGHNKLYEYISQWINTSNTNKHLVLLGDYGMGKTSFLKYVAAKLSENYLSTGYTVRFPVFISLTNCSPIHGGIYKTIKSFVAENLGVDYSLFKKLVDKGKILFLLDAFDEMGFIGTKEQRFKQFNEIWQLATKNNKILLTGRPSYFPTEFELVQILAIPNEGHEVVQTLPFAERITLCRLDDNRIKHYIEKYYPGMGQTYFKWIRANNGLYELCKRPSMMHMIREMLEDLYTSSSQIDISAGTLMNKYIEYWINRQKSKNILSAFQGNELKKLEFIQTFFINLASDFYLNDNLKLSADEIIPKINRQVENLDFPGFEKAENKEGFQQELLTGYFIEREDDEYRFVHKSFFDFFVSRMIIELLKKRTFSHKLMFKTWNLEVIDFAYDTIPKKHIENLNIPALLSFSNTKPISLLKLLHFKVDAIIQSLMYYVFKYFLAIYIVIVIVFSFILVTEFTADERKKIFTLPDNFAHIIGILVLIIIATFIAFGLLVKLLNKIKNFTIKSIILSISKNEPNSRKLLKQVFSIKRLTIKLSNLKITKMYPTLSRTFIESVFENVNFYNCKIDKTDMYDCSLRNVTFENSSISNLRFINCQFENVDFSNSKKNKYYWYVLFFDPYLPMKLASRILSKSTYKDAIIDFNLISQNQIDDRTINSIKDFILKNGLVIGIDVLADEWLLEKLYV